jgi:hypothetical protein
MDDSTGRERLQAALREALKARDKVAVPALRSALAAIDNAGAVPPGPAPAAGTGASMLPALPLDLARGKASAAGLAKATLMRSCGRR